MHRRIFAAALAGLVILARASDGLADEKKAAERIEKLGGKIKRDEQKKEKPVIEVDLSSSKALKDDDLKDLKEFKQLEWLALNSTAVTDAGLANIKDLKNLKTLGLLETGITDKGLEHLKALKKLESLNLIRTKVTKEGVESLQKSLPQAMILDEV